jgi:hypothetical protein
MRSSCNYLLFHPAGLPFIFRCAHRCGFHNTNIHFRLINPSIPHADLSPFIRCNSGHAMATCNLTYGSIWGLRWKSFTFIYCTKVYKDSNLLRQSMGFCTPRINNTLSSSIIDATVMWLSLGNLQSAVVCPQRSFLRK